MVGLGSVMLVSGNAEIEGGNFDVDKECCWRK